MREVAQVMRDSTARRMRVQNIRPNAYRVVSVTDNGSGFCLVTTYGDHGIGGNVGVILGGNSVAAYNAAHSITSVASATTFVTSTSYTSTGYGGAWSYS